MVQCTRIPAPIPDLAASAGRFRVGCRHQIRELSMRTVRYLPLMAVALVASWGGLHLSQLTGTPSFARTVAATPNMAVGPQYDTAHVYVAPEDFDRFVASLVATFGGTTSKQGVFTVTPTPSS